MYHLTVPGTFSYRYSVRVQLLFFLFLKGKPIFLAKSFFF